MADGMFEGDENKGARFSYSAVLQAVGKIGYYDESARDEEFGLAPGRGHDFAFIALIAVVGGRTFLQVQPLATPLQLYTQGTGADGAPAGLPGTQTDAESSAGPEGGIVRNQATFVTVGFQVERLAPWCTAAGAADVLTARDDDDFLNGGGTAGPRYGERLQEQIEQAADFLMDVAGGTRKTSQEHLGPIRDWRVGPGSGLGMPGNFWMFSSDYGSGGQSSSMEMIMSVEMARTIRVEQNTALPFLAGRQVIVPYRARQIGYTLCGEPEIGDACRPGAKPTGKSLSPTQVQRMVDEAAEKAAGAVIRRFNKG